MPEPVDFKDTYSAEERNKERWTRGWLLLAVLATAIAAELARYGDAVAEFVSSIREVGLWDGLVSSLGRPLALGISGEVLLALVLGLVALAGLATAPAAGEPRRRLGRTTGEWVLAFLLWAVGVAGVLLGEVIWGLVAAAAAAVPGAQPISLLLVFLILLASFLSILTFTLVFLGPLIVWVIDTYGCVWITFIERRWIALEETIRRLIPVWRNVTTVVQQLVAVWEQRIRTVWRTRRVRVCSGWHWVLSWLCLAFTMVVERFLVEISFWVRVMITVTREVVTRVLEWVIAISTVVRWVVVLVARTILVC